MICQIAFVLVGVLSGGDLFNACIYRCPPISNFYYHYPPKLRVPYGAPCPRYLKVGSNT
jgi:hypothetical protein